VVGSELSPFHTQPLGVDVVTTLGYFWQIIFVFHQH
jgi:hypothetical protein